jgi:hypothetical protein
LFAKFVALVSFLIPKALDFEQLFALVQAYNNELSDWIIKESAGNIREVVLV